MEVLNLKFDGNYIQRLFQVDLDDITTKSIRLRLEADLNEKFDELKVGEFTNVTKKIKKQKEMLQMLQMLHKRLKSKRKCYKCYKC